MRSSNHHNLDLAHFSHYLQEVTVHLLPTLSLTGATVMRSFIYSLHLSEVLNVVVDQCKSLPVTMSSSLKTGL